MKLYYYFFLLFFCFCFSKTYGQSYSDYNRRGDQAIEKNDYMEARMWYAEGLENCDLYSIRKLTSIWVEQPKMRRTMGSIISKCHTCLEDLSDSKESNAMLLLAEYYKQGIGIEKDTVRADSLLGEVAQMLGFPASSGNNGQGHQTGIETPKTPAENNVVGNSAVEPNNQIPKVNFAKKYNLFLAYTYSPTMPVGFSVGGFSRFGFIFSFKTSVNSKSHTYECDNSGAIPGIEDGNPYVFETQKDKWHSWMVTGGALIPVITKKLLFSVEGGYAQRRYLCPVKFVNTGKTAWCYNSEASYKGVVLEAGGVYKYKHLIFTGGANTVAFRDIDMYVSAGFSF